MQSIKTPPRTMMEVFKSLPEGTLAEVINDNLYMSPSPSTAHQRVVRQLAFAIFEFVKQNRNGAEVFFSPYDVFLDEHSNAVQPDIIFISGENKRVIQKDAIHGVPDMLIEILSPFNSDHDRFRKKALYEKFGVREFWLVVPETKESEGFLLKDDKYVELGLYIGKVRSALLGNTEFNF